MFAIYFPGKTGASLKHFHDVGLGDLLDGDADRAPSFVDFLPGPDGKPGVAATWMQRAIIQGEFDWTPCRKDLFWLGKVAGEIPKPEWFARGEGGAPPHLGQDVKMGDGQEWHIPTARQLPHLLGLDDEGNLTRKLLPHYKRFWEAAEKTVAWFELGDGNLMHIGSPREIFDFVSLALSINYRVNADVASWLGLVRDDIGWTVAGVVTEWRGLLEAQKKTRSAGQLTSAGAMG